jgi:hypothetical protein
MTETERGGQKGGSQRKGRSLKVSNEGRGRRGADGEADAKGEGTDFPSTSGRKSMRTPPPASSFLLAASRLCQPYPPRGNDFQTSRGSPTLPACAEGARVGVRRPACL